MPALLLHLPKVFAEAAFFGSAFGLGCWLVVAIAQAEKQRKQRQKQLTPGLVKKSGLGLVKKCKQESLKLI